MIRMMPTYSIINTNLLGFAGNNEAYAPAWTIKNSTPAITTSNHSPAKATGNHSPAITTRSGSPAITTGWNSPAITTENEALASATGPNSIACALGIEAKAKAGENGAIVISKWDDDYNLNGGIFAMVGDTVNGVKIQPNHWYGYTKGNIKDFGTERFDTTA